MDKTKKLQLNIIQWNAQSIKTKLTSFEHLLSTDKIHIAALCETWLDSNFHFRIKEYNVFRKDRQDGYGGVAIVTHRSIRAQFKDLKSSNPGIEVICVKILNLSIFRTYCLHILPSVSLHMSTRLEFFIFNIK